MHILILFVSIVAFVGCRQHVSSAQLRSINESLVRANHIIASNNDEYYHTLESRMADPQMIRLIKPWYPASFRVFTLSRKMRTAICNLDSLLDAGHELSVSEKNIFFDSLVGYKRTLLTAFDSTLRAEDRPHITEELQKINRRCKILIGYADSIRSAYAKKWIDSVLGSSDPMVVRLELNKIKNDIGIEENMRVTYIATITGSARENFLTYYPTVFLEPDEVKAGQEIEVRAGIVGGYIGLARLEITIDGVRTTINDRDKALAVRKIKADVPGKHVIPVAVEMTFANGDSYKSVHMLTYLVHN